MRVIADLIQCRRPAADVQIRQKYALGVRISVPHLKLPRGEALSRPLQPERMACLLRACDRINSRSVGLDGGPGPGARSVPDAELDRVMGWEVEWDIDCGVLEGEDPSVLDIDPDVLSGSGSVVSGVFQLLQDLDGSPMLVLDQNGTPVEFLRSTRTAASSGCRRWTEPR